MTRLLRICALAGLALPALLNPKLTAQASPVRDAEAGVAFTLPSEAWKRSTHDRSGVLIRLYSPSKKKVPRFGVLRFPAIYLPRGMTTRAKQVLAQKQVKKLGDGTATIGGREAVTLDYHVPAGKVRTVEYGVRVDKFFYILQVVDFDTGWADPEKKASYDALVKSVEFLKVDAALGKVKHRDTDPAALWKTRAPEEAVRTFEITRHDLTLTIEPAKKSLRVVDDFTVRILAADVESLVVACTNVDVDGIESNGKALEFKRVGNTLKIALPSPPEKGATMKLRFEAHHDEYVFAADSKLVAEIAVYGQVGETSSYSSHVHYYPTDRKNDAAVRMRLDVPAAYTAVTGGPLLEVATRGSGDEARRVFTYETTFRTPRQLPFGFAVGRFEKLSGESDGGLAIDIYYLEGKKREAQQRLDVVLGTAKMLEALMGPLPWNRVAFCHVKPERAGMGVALPGLVLFSDDYFGDATAVKLDGASLIGDTPAMGLLIFADELSHQWNFYAMPLPNEFAEGVSTFTNLLYVEQRSGASEYVAGMKAVAGAYLSTAEGNTDVAIADPALYRSPMYRTTAFCKVPAILHSLRRQLGDETFFRAWRETVAKLRGRTARYREVVAALGHAAGQDLRPFFEQWFFRPGHPRLRVQWHARTVDGGRELVIGVEQTQPGAPFVLSLPVVAELTDGRRVRLEPAALGQGKRQSFIRRVDGPVKRLIVDPDGDWPVMRSTVRVAPKKVGR